MHRLLALVLLSGPTLAWAAAAAPGSRDAAVAATATAVAIPQFAAAASPPARAVVRRARPAAVPADEEAPASDPGEAAAPGSVRVRVGTRATDDAAPATVNARPGQGTTVRQPRPSAPATVHATAVVMSPAQCEQVRMTGNTHRERILSHLDIALAGTEHPIDASSTLLLQRVQDIEFRGCDVRVSARVALLRQGQADAVGDARLLGRVNHFAPARSELCFEDRPVLEAVNVGGSRGVNDIRMGAALQRVRPLHRCIDWR